MDTADTAAVLPLDETAPAALYNHHPAETNPKLVHIELDLRTGQLTAGYNPEVGTSSYPESVWRQERLWWTLPPALIPTAAAANKLLTVLLPTAQRILDGATIECDSHNNNVGRFDRWAKAASEKIAATIDSLPNHGYSRVEVTTAADWYGGYSNTEVGADMTDADLADMAEEHRLSMPLDSPDGYPVLEGAVEYLTEAREELRTGLRQDLIAAAQTCQAAKERRNRLIRELRNCGESQRSLGRLAGISHAAVQWILGRPPVA